MAYGRRCCRDSVAMWVIAHDEEPTAGQTIECRWCLDGYGKYDGARWTYHTELEDQIARQVDEIASPEFLRLKSEWPKES